MVALAAVSAWGWAANARALPFEVRGWVLGERVYVESNVLTGNVWTAQFDVYYLGRDGASFCIDLAQTIGRGVHDMTPTPVSDLGLEAAAYMFDSFALELSRLTGAARTVAITGLQLAIWETVYEGPLKGPGAWDLTTGLFKASASAEAMKVAATLLQSLAGVPDLSALALPGSKIVAAVSGTVQDQLFRAYPVPEPSAALLFAAGGAVVAGALRRTRGARR